MTLKTDLQSFLATLWHSTDPAELSHSLLSFTLPGTKMTWHLPAHHVLEAVWGDGQDWADLSAAIGGWNAEADLRINIGLRDRAAIMARDPELDPPAPSRVRGTRREVSVLPCFSMEFDIGQEGHAADAAKLPPSRDAVMEFLESIGIPMPTLEVGSGHGLHGHWVFETPIFLFLGGKNLNKASSVLRQFQAFQKRIIENAPWHIDSTAGPEREWRAPGTFNRKILSRPRPVILSNVNTTFYNPDELAPISKRRSRVAVQMAKELSSSDQPLDKLKALLAGRKPDSANYEEIQLLLQGKPFATKGQRDTTMQRLVSTITFTANRAGLKDLDFSELFAPSTEAWDDEPWADKLQDKIERARNDFVERDNERRQELQAIEKGLTKRSSVQEHTVVRQDGVEAVPRIVRYRDDYWLYGLIDNQYKPRSYVKGEVLGRLREIWPEEMHGDLTSLTEAGKIKDKTPEELITQFGVHVDSVRQSVLCQNSYYEADSETFYIAIAPYREDLDPVFSPLVDEYLAVLGGDEQQLLREWLASCFHLEDPTAGLYLEAHPNAGKNFFAHGAASIWKSRAPTRFDKFVAERFAYLVGSPIIHIDEGVPDHLRKGVTSKIRSLITEMGSHTIEHKGKDPFQMDGTVRLLITANNPDAIYEPGVTFTLSDTKAIIERIAYVRGGEHAVAWIKETNARLKREQRLAGRKIIGLREVIESGEFANHMAHLATEIEFESDRLHCSQNELTRWHLHVVLKGSGGDSNILQWLARMTTDPSRFYQHATGSTSGLNGRALTSVGNGQIRVRSQELLDAWSVYMSATRLPSIDVVNRALSKLAVRDGNVYIVRVDFLKMYVEESQIGDWNKIEANLHGLVVVK